MRTIEADVAIVGSGAGGGTVAERLAVLCEQGARVLLLEAGPHYTRDYFTQRVAEMSQTLFNQGGGFATLDGAIIMTQGRMVGGSTGVYTGVTFRVPDRVLEEDWQVPGVTPEDLAPRFDRIEERINVVAPQDELVNPHNRLFRKGVEALGWECRTIRLNLKGCKKYGFCNLGCASGGKQGTLEVEVPRATSRGVRLVPNALVRRVAGEGLLDVRIREAPAGSEPGPEEPGEVRVEAKKIVLAGSTTGSPGILLNSPAFRRLPTLGRFVTLHPATTVYGIHPEPVNGHLGFPKTYYCDQFSDSEGHYIETAFYYPMMTAKSIDAWGAAHRSIMRRYTHLMSCILLVHDRAEAHNRVLLGGGGVPQIKYRLSRESLQSLARSQRRTAEIFFAAGCDEVHLGLSSKILLDRDDQRNLDAYISADHFRSGKTSINSAHLMGGCRMGEDPEKSVCDGRGRVHGTDWLYVADGSLFPSCSHVNPYLTIMALADRVAEGILESR